MEQQQNTKILAAAFVDHLAVLTRLNIKVAMFLPDRVYWKMNTSLLDDKGAQGRFKDRWAAWRRQRQR
jgi:hypothetical protein